MPHPPTGLTARERQILLLLAQGKSSKEIAVLLGITIATVASHRKSICHKLNVHSVAELIFKAMLLADPAAAAEGV